eukprot:sb/3477404/
MRFSSLVVVYAVFVVMVLAKKHKCLESVGCWKDNAKARAVPSLGNVKGGVDGCRAAAKKKGSSVVAVQGGVCYGGFNAVETYAKYGPSKECKGGNGGKLASDVYLIAC